MLKRVLLGAFLLSSASPALAVPITSRPDLPSPIIDVRALRAPCTCRPRMVKRVASAKPKKHVTIITVSVTSREERRRKKRYDIPDIPKRK